MGISMKEDLYKNLVCLPTIHRIVKTFFSAASMKRYWTNEHPELFYVIKNSFKAEMNGKFYEINPGDIVLVPPGVQHRGFPESEEGVFQIMIIFSWEISDYLLEKVHCRSQACRMKASSTTHHWSSSIPATNSGVWRRPAQNFSSCAFASTGSARSMTIC